MTEPALPRLDDAKRWLLVVAAPLEAEAVVRGAGSREGRESERSIHWRREELSSRIDLVVTGVGKACAAGGTACALDPARHGGVVSLGIGGALPGSNLALGAVVLANASVFADEGVQLANGFQDLGQMGFAPNPDGPANGMGVAASPSLTAHLRPLADRVGPIACVSSCSGTNEAAREVARRSGAIVEAMEGAAVGLSARRCGGVHTAFAELRIVSNTTGDREDQRWDLSGAMNRLRELSALL